MAKSPHFKAFKRALQKSLFLNENSHLKNALEDYQAANASGRATLHDRRQFIKSSAALGLTALPLTAFIANCATAPKSSAGPIVPGMMGDSSAESVVILGAGLAGLTAAYRLGKAGIPCEVYEAQNRIGGRVHTHDGFNAEGMFCELGGELIDSTHEDILALSHELGVRHNDFRPYDAQVKHHQFYFGGNHYFDAELAAACEPLAKRLLGDMRQVFRDLDDPGVTYHSPLPGALKFDRISLEEYLYGMNDVDKWVRDAINMAYLTEYGLDTGEQSCLNLMMLIDPQPEHDFGIYGESDEAMRTLGGNSRLVEALSRALQPTTRVHLEHRLVRIEEKSSRIELTLASGGSSRTVSASRVICALPFSILRDVDGVRTLPLSPVKRECIAQLGYGQNTKRLIGFKSRHWRKPQGRLPAASGYTFTDLPSQTFWDSSRTQHGNSGIITTFLGGKTAVDPSRSSLESALSDLEAICPGTRALYDGNEILYRWPDNPHAKGSYACPRVGQYTTIVGSPKESELGGKLLFAGEHVSEKYQGYMNGAVQTGNNAAHALIAEVQGQPAMRHRRVAQPVA